MVSDDIAGMVGAFLGRLSVRLETLYRRLAATTGKGRKAATAAASPRAIEDPQGTHEAPYVRRAPVNPAIDAVLKGALDTHHLAYAIVLKTPGELFAEAGSPDRLTYRGLASGYLGPYGSATQTYDWIASHPRELLPQHGGQGGDFAVLDRVGKYVVIIFGARSIVPPDMDVKADYYWKKAMGKDVSSRLRPLLTAES